MPPFGLPDIPRTLSAGLIAALAASIGVVVFWGFTVDDALISARVAHQIASGHGYRFNPRGSVVDAVTPLGWAFVLAPFADRSPLDALLAARVLGAALWIVSATCLGAEMARRKAAIWPLWFLPCLAPVGLWSSAGMETGVVMALTTFATRRGRLGGGCLGVAAAWRPEMIPFAFVLTVGRARDLRNIPKDLTAAVGPAILVAVIRTLYFGTPQPLAVLAKPSDLSHGFWYALEALLWSGPLWLLLGPGLPWMGSTAHPPDTHVGLQKSMRWARHLPGLPRLERDEAVLALAILVHFAAVAFAGGDWMPAYRLLAPVMPAMLRVACHVPNPRSKVYTILGCSLALATSLHIATKLAPSARRIVSQRNEMIRVAAKTLKSASVVAAPDVGWVGAAFPGRIVDLAGATDPRIAHLSGGHTSKRITSRVFIANHVDRVLVLLAPKAAPKNPWVESQFARTIDYRAAIFADELGCTPRQSIHIPNANQQYLILGCPDL